VLSLYTALAVFLAGLTLDTVLASRLALAPNCTAATFFQTAFRCGAVFVRCGGTYTRFDATESSLFAGAAFRAHLWGCHTALLLQGAKALPLAGLATQAVIGGGRDTFISFEGTASPLFAFELALRRSVLFASQKPNCQYPEDQPSMQ
jgi:hypothetical protein